MNKTIIAAIMLLTSATMNSANTISMGDTIRVSPNKLTGYTQHRAVMTIDGMTDCWSIAVTYPEGLSPKLVAGITSCDGMTVPYTDRDGNAATYEPNINVSAAYANISAYIPVMGYWDYNEDGYFDSYGTAKWMPGSYEMFELNLYVAPEFRCGWIIFDGQFNSGRDDRGAILQGVKFYCKTWVWVGYMRGDITGNERLTIDDVSELIHYLLTDEGLDEFQIAAADVNGDGVVTITDVTELINILLTT